MAGGAGFTVESQISDYCPAIALPSGWDEFLSSLDAHDRKETRRKINKAFTKGHARVERCLPDDPDLTEKLGVAFTLMEQAPGQKGITVKKYLKPVLDTAAPALITSSRLWLTTLYINDEPSAVTLEFPSLHGPMLYNCGFDQTKKEWSCGVVLTAKIIERAINSGAKTFDIMRGEEPYKYRLGAVNKPLWTLYLSKG
jgi:hypothetical protein